MVSSNAVLAIEQPGERADSRRNRRLLIAAAETAVAEHGVHVSALDIATAAGVGVGTLYRRFGSKEALIECIVLMVIEEVRAAAERGLANPDPWDGLATFMIEWSEKQLECRGLAQLAASYPDRTFARFTDEVQALRAQIAALTARAHEAGVLRADVTWQDLALLSRAPLETCQAVGLQGDARQWLRTVTIVLDGLRAPGASALPGSPPQEVAT